MEANRAILFADIEGSVQLFRTLGDAPALRLVEQCHAAIRAAVETRRGFVVKSIGDGLMAAFGGAGDACHAAIAAQVACSTPVNGDPEARIRLRIGIHAGPVIVTEDDCFGDTVNIAARLGAVANGGEIIIGEAVAATLPPELAVMRRRLGSVALKGVSEDFPVTELLWAHDAAATLLPHDIAKETVAPTRYRLELSQGSRHWRSGEQRALLELGRRPDCAFSITDPRASRDHATVQLVGEQWVITDHSTNGTFVAFAGEGAVALRRKDLVLHGLGAIGFGFDPAREPADAVRFTIFSASR